MLTMALVNRTTIAEFQPQNNKQAYLAYLCGADIALPEPRTTEEVLLHSLCVSGGVRSGGGNRPAVNVSYWNFQRDVMVEMFNAMPDISADTNIAEMDKTVIITGNPCVLGEVVIPKGAASANNYAEASAIFKNIPLDTEIAMTINKRGVEQIAPLDVALVQLKTAPYPIVISWRDITYEVEKLTDEDRAIATNKGWILVEG